MKTVVLPYHPMLTALSQVATHYVTSLIKIIPVIFEHTHAHARTHTHARTHAHTHTHTHTHIHSQVHHKTCAVYTSHQIILIK